MMPYVKYRSVEELFWAKVNKAPGHGPAHLEAVSSAAWRGARACYACIHLNNSAYAVGTTTKEFLCE